MLRALVLLLGGAALYGWFAAFLPTARHPLGRRFWRGPPRGRVVVACGASATHGRMSYDWMAELERRFGDDWTFVNTGFNGWRATNVRARVGRAAQWKPDFAVIMVGVNDAHAGTPIDGYRDHLRAVVAALRPAEIALLTLTVVGDDPAGAAAARQTPYNDVIREVARETGVTCLDVSACQLDWLARQPRHPKIPLVATIPLMFVASFQRYVLWRSWDQISAFHGLLLTTDLVHQNSRGGEMIVDEVERFLRGHRPTGS